MISSFFFNFFKNKKIIGAKNKMLKRVAKGFTATIRIKIKKILMNSFDIT